MRFTRKLSRSLSKSLSKGFSGSNGGLFAYLKSKYYLYIIPTRQDDIETLDDGGSGYKNFGTGNLESPIKNVQVATFDGIKTIGFTDLSGRSITDSLGTGTPSINGNNIEVTAGYLAWFEFDTGERFYCMCGKDDKIYGTLGTVGTLSDTTGVWANTVDDIEAFALTKGGSLFQNISDSEYLTVVGYDLAEITGYNKIGYFEPYVGFWNTGNTIDWVNGDAGLLAIANAYGIDSPITFNALKDLLVYPDYEIVKTDNSISRLKIRNDQDVFNNYPRYISGAWRYPGKAGSKTKVNIICLGNSLTYQTGGGLGWPERLVQLLSITHPDLTITSVNSGVGGATLYNLLTDYDNLVKSKIVPDAINILIINEFINEFIAPAYSSYKANMYMENIALKAKMDGITTFVSTCPEMPEEVQPYSDDACIYLINNNDYAYGIIDFRNYPGLDDTTNATYRTVGDVWPSGGVHLTDAGRQLMAECANIVISPSLGLIISEETENNVKVAKSQILKFEQTSATIGAQKPGQNNFEYGVHIYGQLSGDAWGGILQCGMSTSAQPKSFGLFKRSTTTDQVSVLVGSETGGSFVVNLTLFLGTKHNIIVVKRIGDILRIILYKITDVDVIISSDDISLPESFDFSPTGAWKLGEDISVANATFYAVKAWYNCPNIEDGFEYNFKEQYGNILSDTLGNYDISANNLPADAWDTMIDDIEPTPLTDGCTVFTNGADYVFARLNTLTYPGFTKIGDYSASSGILKGLSNTYLGLKYSDWELNEKTFDEISAIPIIDKDDFRYTLSPDGNKITDIAAQPYQQYMDVGGNPVYTQDDKEFWVIKTF